MNEWVLSQRDNKTWKSRNWGLSQMVRASIEDTHCGLSYGSVVEQQQTTPRPDSSTDHPPPSTHFREDTAHHAVWERDRSVSGAGRLGPSAHILLVSGHWTLTLLFTSTLPVPRLSMPHGPRVLSACCWGLQRQALQTLEVEYGGAAEPQSTSSEPSYKQRHTWLGSSGNEFPAIT